MTLYQYCKKQNLSTPNLKEYIENREGILSEIMKNAKVSRDEAKKSYYLSLMEVKLKIVLIVYLFLNIEMK